VVVVDAYKERKMFGREGLTAGLSKVGTFRVRAIIFSAVTPFLFIVLIMNLLFLSARTWKKYPEIR